MNWPDFNGIAACIAALGGLATVGMQVIQFFDTRRVRREQEVHKEQLTAINTKVDTLVKADTE